MDLTRNRRCSLPGLVAAAAAALLCPVAAQGEARSGIPVWQWAASDRTPNEIDASFVRAQVTVLRKAGPAHIRVSALHRPAGESLPTVEALEQDGLLEIWDRYPVQSVHWNECLPPADKHGGFWGTSASLLVQIVAPPATRVRVHVMEGRIVEEGRPAMPTENP